MSPRATRTTFVYLIAVLGLAILWSCAALWWKPYPGATADFIYSEPGQNLFLADRLNAGATLYRDVFLQYGLLPFLVHWGVTKVFGNTADHYLALHQALSIAGCLGIFLVLRRNTSGRVAFVWTLVAMFPCFLMPGSLNDNANSFYPPYERLAFLLLAFVWVHPRDRSIGRSVAVGLILGSMQLCKFGTAAIAGAALLATDLLVLGSALVQRETWRRWLPTQFAILAGFLAVEGMWAAWLVATLPAAWAIDVLWPLYMVKSYRSYSGADLSYWTWFNTGYFAVAQLPVALGFALSALLLLRQVVPQKFRLLFRNDAPLGGAPLFLALCLPIALAVGFLPHRWTILPWVWMPIAAAAAVAFQLRPVLQIAVAMALAPSFLISAKGRVDAVAGRTTPPHRVRLDTPSGEALWASPQEVERFAKVSRLVEEMHQQRTGGDGPVRMIAFNLISGWEHFFGYQQHGSRHAWLITSFVRRDEEAALVASLDTSSVVILHAYTAPLLGESNAVTQLTSDPRSWGRFCNPGLSDETAAIFARRLGPPVMVDEWCALFPVR